MVLFYEFDRLDNHATHDAQVHLMESMLGYLGQQVIMVKVCFGAHDNYKS